MGMFLLTRSELWSVEQQKQSLLCGISSVCANSVSTESQLPGWIWQALPGGYGLCCPPFQGPNEARETSSRKLEIPGDRNFPIWKSSVTCPEVWLPWKIFSSSAILSCKLCIGSGHKFKVFLSKSVVGLVCLFVYGKLCSLVLLVIYPHLLESVFPNCNRFFAIKRCKQFQASKLIEALYCNLWLEPHWSVAVLASYLHTSIVVLGTEAFSRLFGSCLRRWRVSLLSGQVSSQNPKPLQANQSHNLLWGLFKVLNINHPYLVLDFGSSIFANKCSDDWVSSISR